MVSVRNLCFILFADMDASLDSIHYRRTDLDSPKRGHDSNNDVFGLLVDGEYGRNRGIRSRRRCTLNFNIVFVASASVPRRTMQGAAGEELCLTNCPPFHRVRPVVLPFCQPGFQTYSVVLISYDLLLTSLDVILEIWSFFAYRRLSFRGKRENVENLRLMGKDGLRTYRGLKRRSSHLPFFGRKL